MSRFSNFRSGVREKVASALGIDNHTLEEDSSEPTPEELAKEDEESRKHEYRLMLILENIRELYFKRGLIGSAEISCSLLFACNSISCDINGTEEPSGKAECTIEENSETSDKDKLPILLKLTIKNVTRLIHRLEIRARNYKDKSYKEDLSIVGSINITDPLGFTSVSITCSASIESLLKPADNKA